MGARLEASGLVPDCVLASTAVRARTTAELVCSGWSVNRSPQLMDSLYLPSTDDIVEAAACHGGTADCVLVVAHNPGVTEAIRSITRADERVPTATVAVIDFDLAHWSDLLIDAHGTLRCVFRPKDSDNMGKSR